MKHHRVNQSLCYHEIKNMSISHEATIRLIGIDTTILGSTLTPLVSSSKNLKRPALDAGKGALFLSAMTNLQD